MKKKYPLMIILSLLLVSGFLITSLASYYVSRSSLREQISKQQLPLTSDNVYSEIQRDLIRPVFISSLMSTDTFLRDWVLQGEPDQEIITKYLKEIQFKYNTFTSFFVSDKSNYYYHADGILKEVRPDEERDEWYYRVRTMAPDYEINVDPDMANQDAMTIFVNYRVFDYTGNFIGATGVGLTVTAVKNLIDVYKQKYGRNIFFTDKQGNVVLSGSSFAQQNTSIYSMDGISSIAEEILSNNELSQQYKNQGKTVYLNSRFVDEYNWFLIVEQTDEGAIQDIIHALIVNLLICAVITIVVIVLVGITISTYQGQQEKMVTSLQKALNEVKTLSGLIPICASCKKIRDDKGYWNQIESYIKEHSNAEFSHGFCPDCARKLYPEVYKNE